MNRRGFTLLELLIVIGILAVLSTVAVLVINPAEYLKQSRDAKRIGDMMVLNKALGLAEFENISLGGASTTVFVSLVDTISTCANFELPPLPVTRQYRCITDSSNLRKIDGTGWIPVDLTAISSGSPLATLPIDPLNAASGNSYYTYVPGGSFELTAGMESDKYAKEKATDGGLDPARFEIGSNLTLSPFSGGMVGYWKFDEESGSIARDSAGGHDGVTAIGAPTWVSGKIGGGIEFTGSSAMRMLNVGSPASSFVKGHTIVAWFKPNAVIAGTNIFASFGLPYLSVHSAGNKAVHSVNVDGVQRTFSGQTAITAGTWYMIAGTFDTNEVAAYLNGNKEGAGKYSGADVVGSSLCVGAHGCSSYWTNGVVDELRIYNRALSSSEIKALYDATK